MLFIGTVVTAVAVALARGGRLERLATLPLRYEGLIIVALLLRLLLFFAGRFGVELAPSAVWAVQACSYALLLATAWLNRAAPGMRTLGLGFALNALVILANGGLMPVSEAAATASGQAAAYAALAESGSYLHRPLTEATRLAFLG
ncbi:MAG TPA: DUF5317 family protein, partial [Bacillota bacterium]